MASAWAISSSDAACHQARIPRPGSYEVHDPGAHGRTYGSPAPPARASSAALRDVSQHVARARRPASARATARPSPAGSAGSPSSASRIQALPSGQPGEGLERSRRPSTCARAPTGRVAGGPELGHQRPLTRELPAADSGRSGAPASAQVASSSVRDSSARQPCPGAGVISPSGMGRAIAAAQAFEPGRRQHQRVVVALLPASAAGCPRCRAARGRRGRAELPAAARGGAGWRCPPPRPSASAAIDSAPQSASRASARSGTPTMASPSGSSAGHVLGRVHGQVHLAPQQRLLDLLHEAGLVVALARVARGLDRHELHLPAEHAPPRPACARQGAGERAAASPERGAPPGLSGAGGGATRCP